MDCDSTRRDFRARNDIPDNDGYTLLSDGPCYIGMISIAHSAKPVPPYTYKLLDKGVEVWRYVLAQHNGTMVLQPPIRLDGPVELYAPARRRNPPEIVISYTIAELGND